MALFDKVLGKDNKENQLKQEINSLKLRKELICQTINGEIARLQGERNDIFRNAGEVMYHAWCTKEEQNDLTEYWNKVQEIEKQIAEQEDKRADMCTRYDEELRLISNNIQSSGTASTSFAGQHCPKCNTPIAMDDIFCQGCGTKLK